MIHTLRTQVENDFHSAFQPESLNNCFESPGHKSTIPCLAFLEKSKKIVSLGSDYYLKLWSMENYELISFTHLPDKIINLDRMLLTVEPDKIVVAYNNNNKADEQLARIFILLVTSDNKLVELFAEPIDKIYSLTLSEENFLCACLYSKAIMKWNLNDLKHGELNKDQIPNDLTIEYLKISKHENYIISIHADNIIRLRDKKGVELLKIHEKVKFDETTKKSLHISSTESFFLLTTNDITDPKQPISRIKIIKIANHEEILHEFVFNVIIVSVVLTSDDGHIMVCFKNQVLKYLTIEKKHEIEFLNSGTSPITTVNVTTKNHRVAISYNNDKSIRILDLYHKTELANIKTAHNSMVCGIYISQNSKYLVSGSADKTVKIWDIKTKSTICSKTNDTRINCLTVSKDCQHIYTVDEQNVKRWTFSTDEAEKPVIIQGIPQKFKCELLVLTPDDMYLVVGITRTFLKDDPRVSPFTEIRVIDCSNPSNFKIITDPHTMKITSSCFVLVKKEKVVQANQQPQTMITIQKEPSVSTAQIKNEPKEEKELLLYTASEDKSIKCWKFVNETFQEIDKFEVKKNHEVVLQAGKLSFQAMAVTHDNKIMLSSTMDNHLQIWNLEKTRHTPQNIDTNTDIKAIAISPNLRYFVTSSSFEIPDTTTKEFQIKIWSLFNLDIIHVFDNAHQDISKGLEISPDGNFIISGSNDQTIKYWHLENNVPEFVFDEMDQHMIWPIDISQKDEFFVTGRKDSALNVWELSSQGLINTYINAHDGHLISELVYFNNRNAFVTGSSDKILRIWGINDVPIQLPLKSDSLVTSISISQDDSFLACGTKTGHLTLWKISGETILLFDDKVTPDQIHSLYFDSANEHLIIGSEKSFLSYSLKKDLLGQGKYPSEDVMNKILFDDAGKVLYAWSSKNCIIKFNYKDKTWADLKIAFDQKKKITEVALSRDYLNLALGMNEGSIYLYDTQSDVTKRSFKNSHFTQITKIVFSRDNTFFLTVNNFTNIEKWMINDIKTVSQYKYNHKNFITGIGYLERLEYIITVSLDKSIRIWNNDTKMLYIHLKDAHEGPITSLVINNPHLSFITGSEDKRIKVWRFEEDILKCVYQSVGEHTEPITAMQLSHDGEFLIAGTAKKEVKLWRYSSEFHNLTFLDELRDATTTTLYPLEKKINSIAFSKEGNYFVTASSDYILRLFHLVKSEDKHNYSFDLKKIFKKNITRNITAVAASPNGDYVIAAFYYKEPKDPKESKENKEKDPEIDILIWQLTPEVHIKYRYDAAQSHTKEITSILITDDNNYFITVSCDKSIRFWSLQTGEFIYQIENAHEDEIKSMAIITMSIDNGESARHILTGSKTLKMWKVPEMIFKSDSFSSLLAVKPEIRVKNNFKIYPFLWNSIHFYFIQGDQESELGHKDHDKKKKKDKDHHHHQSHPQNHPQNHPQHHNFHHQHTHHHNTYHDKDHKPENKRSRERDLERERYYKLMKDNLESSHPDPEHVKDIIAMDMYGRIPLLYAYKIDPKTFKIEVIDKNFDHTINYWTVASLKHLHHYNKQGFIKLMSTVKDIFFYILETETLTQPRIVLELFDLCVSEKEVTSKDERHRSDEYFVNHVKRDFASADFGDKDLIEYGSSTNKIVEFKDINEVNINLLAIKDEKHRLKYQRTLVLLELDIESDDVTAILGYLEKRHTRHFFENDFIMILVDHLWEKSKKYQYISFAIHSLFIILFTIESADFDYSVPAMHAILLVYSIILFGYEISQLYTFRLEYFEIWNNFDFTCFGSVAITMGILLSNGQVAAIPYLKTVGLLTGYFRWLGYFRIFGGMRSMIRTIIEIIYDMKSFTIILCFFILSVTTISQTYGYGDKLGFGDTMYQTYLLIFNGQLPDDEDHYVSQGLLYVSFLFPFIINVIFLNMLINIMGDTFDRIQEKKGMADNQERIKLMVESVGIYKEYKEFFLQVKDHFVRFKKHSIFQKCKRSKPKPKPAANTNPQKNYVISPKSSKKANEKKFFKPQKDEDSQQSPPKIKFKKSCLKRYKAEALIASAAIQTLETSSHHKRHAKKSTSILQLKGESLRLNPSNIDAPQSVGHFVMRCVNDIDDSSKENWEGKMRYLTVRLDQSRLEMNKKFNEVIEGQDELRRSIESLKKMQAQIQDTKTQNDEALAPATDEPKKIEMKKQETNLTRLNTLDMDLLPLDRNISINKIGHMISEPLPDLDVIKVDVKRVKSDIFELKDTNTLILEKLMQIEQSMAKNNRESKDNSQIVCLNISGDFNQEDLKSNS